MGFWWLLLIPVLLLALYRTGFLSMQIAAASAGWNWCMPRWWKGRYAYLSGRLIRWFRSGGPSVLRIFVAGEAGSLSLEIVDRFGAVQHAWYGVTTLDTQVEIGESGRFSLHLRGEQFRGSFSLFLEV